jgi:glycosyltransferase involved in cell wall biosynthesis
VNSSNIISLIIPTRKRIKSLHRLFNSIEKTCSSTDNLEVLLAIDDDDIDTIQFVEKYSKNSKLLIRTIIGKRGKGYLDLHNRIGELCQASSGNFLFFLGDDVQFTTKNWDEKILATYNSIYGDNIFWIRTSHNEEGNPWAACLAITRDWYNITGHLGTCYQQDTEFNFVARHVGREVFMKDIVIIHHRTDDKTGYINGEVDQTYVEGRMAADAGLVKGRTVWSREVQTNIIVDAIKLLKRIRSLQGQEKDAEISAKIRYLYCEYVYVYVKARLQPIIPISPSWVRKIMKWVMRIK